MPSKTVVVSLAVSFILGVIVGYQLKTVRINYLKAKRDRLSRKLQKTHQEIHAAI